MATAPSSSDEAAQVLSVPLKQWAAELVQAFHDLIIRQRSLYNHPAGLLPRARIWYREKGIVSCKSYLRL